MIIVLVYFNQLKKGERKLNRGLSPISHKYPDK